MAIIKCYNCGKDASDRSRQCVYCKAQFQPTARSYVQDIDLDNIELSDVPPANNYRPPQQPQPQARQKRSPLVPILLTVMICSIIGAVIFFALNSDPAPANESGGVVLQNPESESDEELNLFTAENVEFNNNGTGTMSIGGRTESFHWEVDNSHNMVVINSVGDTIHTINQQDFSDHSVTFIDESVHQQIITIIENHQNQIRIGDDIINVNPLPPDFPPGGWSEIIGGGQGGGQSGPAEPDVGQGGGDLPAAENGDGTTPLPPSGEIETLSSEILGLWRVISIENIPRSTQREMQAWINAGFTEEFFEDGTGISRVGNATTRFTWYFVGDTIYTISDFGILPYWVMIDGSTMEFICNTTGGISTYRRVR